MELMIILAIVSVLLTVAIPMYADYVVRTKISAEVFVLTARAKEIFDLKKSDKDFYIGGDDSVNEYAALSKDIGSTGMGIVDGYAELMVRPEDVPTDTIRWRCIVAGDNIKASNIPAHCILGTNNFFRILKENNMIFSEDNFQYGEIPIGLNSWGKVDTGSDYLGKWYITGGDEQIEIWNEFDNIDDKRANVAELDGDHNEIVDFAHDLQSKGFDSMQMSFDYYSRTGNSSSGFEVYLGDELVYTHDNFSQGWQSVNLDLNNSNAAGKKLTIRESGADDSFGALIDLDTLKVTPNKVN